MSARSIRAQGPGATLLFLFASACARPAAGPTSAVEAPPLTVERGDFQRRLLLTGEIDAVAAVELTVPRVPNGKTTIRYLAPEGTEVKAGDRVVELDRTIFIQQIKDRTLQLSQAEIDLERQISQNGVTEADREMDVERKRAVAERAEVDAEVPEGILPKRDYLDKKMAVRRARVDLERAEEALATQRAAGENEIKIRRIALDKLRRALKATQDALATLTLRASSPGAVILGDHLEEGRKLQEGDDVAMGMTVARVSSSNARRVRAWLVDVDDGKIAGGMPALVTLDAYPRRQFAGTVRDISPMAQAPGELKAQAQRRVFTARIDLADASSELLRPGLSARVEVITDRRNGVLLVPRAAIDLGGQPPRVALASGASQPVPLAGCNAQVCVATSGLQAGESLRRAGP